MTRQKVKLAFIANDSKRKTTFRKRKKSLMKKVEELSILCGIHACAIVFSPYYSQPEVWPSPSGVYNVLARFMGMPEPDQRKKMITQEGFLNERIFKTQDQILNVKKENRRKEMTHAMHQYLGGEKQVNHVMSVAHLKDLTWVVEENLREITRKMEEVMNKNQSQAQVAALATADRAKELPEPMQRWSLSRAKGCAWPFC